jgi:hypothetical protein
MLRYVGMAEGIIITLLCLLVLSPLVIGLVLRVVRSNDSKD